MNAFLVLKKDTDLSTFNGNVDVQKYKPFLYSSFEKALASTGFSSKNHFVAEVEFTDKNEIREAVMRAYGSGVASNYMKMRVLRTLIVQDCNT